MFYIVIGIPVILLTRLKKVGYFCGMDYASEHIYLFEYKISRYEHSLTTALLTWKFTKSKKQTIAALFHDVSTPCFSHVIDYMNKDYENQESTEEKTESVPFNIAGFNWKKVTKKSFAELSDEIRFILRLLSSKDTVILLIPSADCPDCT